MDLRWRSLGRWLGMSAVAFCLNVATAREQARAAVLYNGWSYAIDSFNDGVTGGQVGGGAFEFYGLAIKKTSSRVFVALNAHLPLEGYAYSSAVGGSIAWGDLFFNFSGHNFTTASTLKNLFAIRFAQSNDSGAATTGVYSHVTAKSVTAINSGFPNLTYFNNYVEYSGGTPSLADLDARDRYFEQTGNNTVLNEIESGTKLGDILFHNPAFLQAMGLNFNRFQATGSQTIGFSFDRALMPSGKYIANIFAECANDGIAIAQEAEAVPEPSEILGTLTSLSFLGTFALKRKRKLASRSASKI